MSSGRMRRCESAAMRSRLITVRMGRSQVEFIVTSTSGIFSAFARLFSCLSNGLSPRFSVVRDARLRFSVCASSTGSSRIDGIISSGPDSNDFDMFMSIVSHSSCLSSDRRGFGQGDSGGTCCCWFFGEIDGTTQDSPRTELSWGRGEVVVMGDDGVGYLGSVAESVSEVVKQ